jgi:hypothetical protein
MMMSDAARLCDVDYYMFSMMCVLCYAAVTDRGGTWRSPLCRRELQTTSVGEVHFFFCVHVSRNITQLQVFFK